MTYGDHAWVREHYADCHVHAVIGTYFLSDRGPQPGRQLIITNYRLTKAQLGRAPREVKRLTKRQLRAT